METRRRNLNLWLAALIVLATFSLPFGRPATVHAAATGIAILQTTAQSAFPTQVQFGVRAQSSSQISSVRIGYRLGDDPLTFEANGSFAPGFTVVATYVIDLQRDYLPPGVVLHYQWEIQDMSGATVMSAIAELPVTDRRFLWHEKTLGKITLHWYDGTTDFADAVLASASKSFATAQQDALAPWLGPVQVYLYGTQADFRSALGLGTAEWTGGETFSTQHVVMLFAPGSDTVAAQRSISHELAHAAIDGASNYPFGPLPTWLDEGIAMAAEGSPNSTFTDALTKGIQAQRLFSVQSLSGTFPADSSAAILAYAESDSLVRFFITTYGRDRLAILIAAFRAGNSSDDAFQTTVGGSTVDFQRAWMASLAPNLAGTAAGQAASPSPSSSSSASNIISALVRDVLNLFQTKKASPT